MWKTISFTVSSCILRMMTISINVIAKLLEIVLYLIYLFFYNLLFYNCCFKNVPRLE